MKVSLNWVRFINQKYGSGPEPAPSGIDELVEKIGAQLGAVEEVIDIGKKYEGLLIVKVVDCVKHPNADKLSLCLVDDGGVNKKVERKEKSLIQVVCGAPNVKTGQLAVWIPPGATVPASFDKDPFVIEARPIRNKTSHGMLASPKELALGDSHEGILVLEEGKPGDDFAKAAGLDDTVIDIENKMFTHRPDLFGMLGIARELAGIQHKKFKSPAWYREDAGLPADGRKNVLNLAVKNDVPKLVPRFCAVAIKDIKVGPSPAWLQVRLASAGVRPINNIVDVTNLYMLETAQPLHAYDYDKVKSGVLGARLSKKGEKLALLNGKVITLNEGAVVITDGARPIGLAGVMGGADAEVDENTKNIILEAANFDMNQTRKATMEYGLFTDAATRFTKNQSPRQNLAVIVKAVEDIKRLAGGRVASPLIDNKHFTVKDTVVKTSTEFINSRLGLELSVAEIKKILENVEFKVETSQELKITVPFWRTDIEIPEDIVEEVGRLYGYDHLPVVLPTKDLAPAERNQSFDFKARLRDILSRAGANEALNYSFVHEKLFEAVGQSNKDAYHIRNAVSPDLQHYRLSLTPSLLDKIHANQRAGFREFALFEIGLGHNQKMKDPRTKLPVEFQMLSLVFSSSLKSAKTNGAAYYQARKILDYLSHELGIKQDYRPIGAEENYPAARPFDYHRSAQVWDKKTDTPLGMVGEYKASVISALKLPAYSAGFEIGIDQLIAAAPDSEYRVINRFPELEQDITLRASIKTPYSELESFLVKRLDKLCQGPGYGFWLRPLDIFQKSSDVDHKQVTWRIILWHPERTLTTQESNKLLDELAQAAKQELKAERV